MIEKTLSKKLADNLVVEKDRLSFLVLAFLLTGAAWLKRSIIQELDTIDFALQTNKTIASLKDYQDYVHKSNLLKEKLELYETTSMFQTPSPGSIEASIETLTNELLKIVDQLQMLSC